MSLGYTSGGFRFPFRTVKVLTLWDNVRWALRGPGLSSGLASYPPQNQKVTWPRTKFPFFFVNGPWVPFGSRGGSRSLYWVPGSSRDVFSGSNVNSSIDPCVSRRFRTFTVNSLKWFIARQGMRG